MSGDKFLIGWAVLSWPAALFAGAFMGVGMGTRPRTFSGKTAGQLADASAAMQRAERGRA